MSDDPVLPPPAAAVVDPYIDIVGLPSPLRRDKRYIFQATKPVFGVLVAMLPVWIGLILPLSIGWQIITRLLTKIGILPGHSFPPVDSGHTVPDNDAVKPRKERTYDIVILGATGFTGRLAVRHLAKTYYGQDDKNKSVKWAIAGRTKSKVEAVLQGLADELKLPNLVKDIPVIVADTSDPSSMPALVQDTRVVATAAGPYQEYGNTVVEFCAKYGTHYTDITGEAGWVKTMMVAHGDTAKKTGSKIVPFCGHDSIPWDLSVMKLNQLLKKEFDDDLKTVKVWDEVCLQAPGGTYQTATLGLSGKGLYPPRCKVDPFLQLEDGTKSTHSTTEDLPLFLDFFFEGRWTAPFIMALINAKIVRWTHALTQQGEKKISYRECQVHRDFFTAFTVHVGTMMLGSLLLNPITRFLAFNFLLPPPGSGPSHENMFNKFYLLVTAEGMGTNGNRIESTFYVKQDPGCLETAKMMVESGLAMALHETDKDKKLPSGDKGGFFPPAVALGDALLDRLIVAGIEYKYRAVAKPEPKKTEDKDTPKKEDDNKGEQEEEYKPKDKDA